MKDSDLLSYIKKLLERKSETFQGQDSWQEHFDKNTTISSKSIQASEIVRGFCGSWASAYSADPTNSRLDQNIDQKHPANPVAEYSKLGQPGLPEINFPPYDHNTVRFGEKGGALIGHPISFEVIGTTAKSPSCDWQFIAIDNSATADGDKLHLDINASIQDPDGSAGLAPTTAYLNEAYNFPLNGDLPDSGLYLIISMTGEDPSQIDGRVAGLGDGFIALRGVGTTQANQQNKLREPITAIGYHSKLIYNYVSYENNNLSFILKGFVYFKSFASQ